MPPRNKLKVPCGTCSKSAQTNALLCNFFDMWHHATIECIPWHSKETIDTLMGICKETSCWTCQKCTGIMKKLNGRMAKLEKDVNDVKGTVQNWDLPLVLLPNFELNSLKYANLKLRNRTQSSARFCLR